MLAMKGRRAADELPLARRAVQLLGGGVPVSYPVELPDADHHVIIEVTKIRKTDSHSPARRRRPRETQ